MTYTFSLKRSVDNEFSLDVSTWKNIAIDIPI